MEAHRAQYTPSSSSDGTAYRDSCHEVSTVMAEIDECAGPRALIIVAVVSEDSQPEIRDRCIEYNSVHVENELSLPTKLRTLTQNANDKQRLLLIVSPIIETLSLQIPSQFRKVAITACEKERQFPNLTGSHIIKELIMEDDCTYCGVPLAKWYDRTAYLTHELVTGPGVVFDLPDDEILDGAPEPPPFALERESDIEAAVRCIDKEVSHAPDPLAKESRYLPWVSGLVGGAAGTSTAGAFLVSSVKIGVKGLFISAGPYGHFGIGSATLTASLSAGAAAGATSVAVGVGVAAAVYFIPWRKLASWLMDKFSHFLAFLKSIWKKVKEVLSFLKEMLMVIFRFLKSSASAFVGAGASGLSHVRRFVDGSAGHESLRWHA